MSAIVSLSRNSYRLPSQSLKQASTYFSTTTAWAHSNDNAAKPKEVSDRVVMFRNKLRAKTPIGKLDELDEFSVHPNHETEPLKPWPNGVNPHTGEIGGPAGPEPTRYGDWERKGRVTDF